MINVWLCLTFILTGLKVHAGPSFDCGKAKSCEEKLICAKPNLSEIDNQLNQAFTDAKKKLKGKLRSQLVSEQQAWLKSIQSPNCNEVSILSHYRQRIGNIERFALKDPNALALCKDFVENRKLFFYRKDGPGSFDIKGDGKLVALKVCGGGSCPYQQLCEEDKSAKDGQMKSPFSGSEDDNANVYIYPSFFTRDKRLFVSIRKMGAGSEKDPGTSMFYERLGEVTPKGIIPLCSFDQKITAWETSGKDKQLCENLSKAKFTNPESGNPFSNEPTPIELTNDGNKLKVEITGDDAGSQAGCGSEIGMQFWRLIEEPVNSKTDLQSEDNGPTSALAKKLKEITLQEHWLKEKFLAAKIDGKNYLYSEPISDTDIYKATDWIPKKSLYKVESNGTIEEVCSLKAKTKIIITE
ncbi:MAG: lysozyme inhibitor LprI family protein [Bdellovibrionota bacterium]